MLPTPVVPPPPVPPGGAAAPRTPTGATRDRADAGPVEEAPLAGAGPGGAGSRPAPCVRERLLTLGPATLSNRDLVAVVLGTGARGRPVERLADEVLASAGGLRAVAARTPVELSAVRGVGTARAARLLAALELGRRSVAEPLVRGAAIRTSGDVFRAYEGVFRDLRFEQFRVVLLDGKHRVLRDELISQGTLTSSPVHPREVFSAAIRHSAAAIVLVHNHPSGDPTPSADDLEITRRLAQTGDLVGIRVLDHVVVGDGAYASLADRGLMG